MEENIRYEESILLSVRRIMRAIDMHSSYLARQYGLTSPQLICLKKLFEKNEMTPGGLAKEVHLSHATDTGIINRLEKKGLVQRTRSTNDGRSYLIRLTDSGLSMTRSSPSMLQDQFMHELSKLEEWEKTMIRIPVHVNTDSQSRMNIDDRLSSSWRDYNSAARYFLSENMLLDTGMVHVNTSLSLNENWFNTWTKAELFEAMGNRTEAYRNALKAKELGDASDNFFFKDRVYKAVEEWKAGAGKKGQK